jgi:hypothetical protein
LGNGFFANRRHSPMTTPITDPNTYVARARAILATIAGIGTDVTTGIDIVALPAYEVYLKGAQQERQTPGSKKRVVTRVLSMRIYYALVEDASNEQNIRTARNATQSAIETYVDKIFNSGNLNLNDAGVVTTGDAEDSIGMMPFGTHVYFGFDIDLTIFYNRG